MWSAASAGVASLALGGLLAPAALAAQTPEKSPDKPTDKPKVYTCPPCGCPNDGKEFPAPGDCSVCAMPLMEKPPAKTAAPAPGGKPPEPKPAPK